MRQSSAQLVGANPAVHGVGLSPGRSTSSYISLSTPSSDLSAVANYQRVEYAGVYPGIDLTYYGSQRQLEYDFAIAPGADPNAIRLNFAGGQLRIDARGELVMSTAAGNLVEHAPRVYQMVDGVKRSVSGRYVLLGDNSVKFQVGAYSVSNPLVIDPILSYSAYLGGDGYDTAAAVATDAGGNVYVTGQTDSNNFPTSNAMFTSTGTGGQNQSVFYTNSFVAKFDPQGNLVYSTYVSADPNESHVFSVPDTDPRTAPYDGGVLSTMGYQYTQVEAYGIAVDSKGAAYITGQASYTALLPNGAFSYGPALPLSVPSLSNGQTAFVLKLAPSGMQAVYAGYFPDPTTVTSLPPSTQAGASSGTSIAVDSSGNAYITGYDNDYQELGYGNTGFVRKLDPYGSSVFFQQFGDDSALNGQVYCAGIAVSSSGTIYIAGSTNADDFASSQPSWAPNTSTTAFDAFALSLTPGTGAP